MFVEHDAKIDKLQLEIVKMTVMILITLKIYNREVIC